ncbi:hypothetical protein AB8E26_01645 [Stenotrophomonas rhizophila]|uniref:hypothetical protein n=1 Tax=Stenotrophomonas rhizophila TaxID=216778 RepID=UPI00351777E5
MAFRLKLTPEQLRQLRSTLRPKLDKSGAVVTNAKGYAVLEPNPDGKQWRFLDGSPGAPIGFGVFVGKLKSTYEVQRKIVGKVMRISVGDTSELALKDAHDLAGVKVAGAKKEGQHPKALAEKELSIQATKALTVNQAIQLYHDMLARRTRPATAGTLKTLTNSMARLERPEVGIGHTPIMELDEDKVSKAFEATRLSAALHSNRLSQAIKDVMARVGRVELTDEELAKVGVDSEAMRTRIRAAGVSAAEQTFSTAFRAINYAVDKEARAAKKAERKAVLFGNDFGVLWEEGRMRDAAGLHVYYEKARVRNPLGSEDNTLGRAIDYLWSRREAQRGQNESGVYYLLTTLFLGARRNETAKLAWFDRLTPVERETQSWVWLDEMDPEARREGRVSVNPLTKKPGPQVYFAKTKNRRDHSMPLGPFSLQLIKRRFEQRLPVGEPRGRWVYPARSSRAAEGHYKDSKAIMKGLGEKLSVEFGPTPHDLRRTLGRYATRVGISNRITSRLFNHLPQKKDGEDEGSKSSVRYQEPEWFELQDALQRVEQLMASSSPAFYNMLKPVDWPLLPPRNDTATPQQ